jgi:uncharacterized membrane protein SpoIIM required for sporulation
MNLKRWVIEREPVWQEAETLVNRSEQSIYQLSPQEIRQIGFLYRSLLTDLARVRSFPDYQHLVPYLNNLVQRIHGRVYTNPPTQLSDILDFFLIKFPQCFRRNIKPILISFLVFCLGAIIAMITVRLDSETSSYFLPQPVIDMVKAGHLWMDNTQAAPSEASMLMTNNIRVAFNAYVMGVFFGVGTLLVMFNNGMYALGGPLQICIQNGMGPKLLLFMIPHGPLELFTIFVSGGAGMIIGLALLFPGDLPRWEAVRQKAKDSMILIAGCIPLLFIAGLIEGNVSLNPGILPPIKIAISIFTILVLILYLGFSGKEPAKEIQ